MESWLLQNVGFYRSFLPFYVLRNLFQYEISSKCDRKAENSSTLCKFHRGRKGLWPMGSNADHQRLSFSRSLGTGRREPWERGMLTIYMENQEIPGRIQMERFIPVEIFRKKVIPFEVLPFPVFTETNEIFCTICLDC